MKPDFGTFRGDDDTDNSGAETTAGTSSSLMMFRETFSPDPTKVSMSASLEDQARARLKWRWLWSETSQLTVTREMRR